MFPVCELKIKISRISSAPPAIAASRLAGAFGVIVLKTLASGMARSMLRAVRAVGGVVHVAGGAGGVVCPNATAARAMIASDAPILFQSFIWFSS
jgi:hypothetical protein